MSRLNNRAFEILRAEITKCAGNDPLSKIEESLVVRELQLLQKQQGSPASLEELQQIVVTTYPNFREKALTQAAKANRSIGILDVIKLAAVLVVLLVLGSGSLVLAILLYPTNDQPVAQNAPLSNEEHYELAIAFLEQAEKFITQASTAADLALGEEKLNAAKKHIDELPVSHTISSPQYSYRRKKGRRYVSGYNTQTIEDEQTASIRSRFEQVKNQLSEQKQVQGRTETLIKGAKQFAFAAAKLGQNAPHTADKWQQIETLWYKAIEQLQNIRVDDVDYVEAQKLLATYQTNLGTVQTRLKAERQSQEAFKYAQEQIQALLASIPKDGSQVNRNQIISQMQEIINQLQTVKSGTTAYSEAQNLLQSAQKKLASAQK
ncbi:MULTISPECIES: hypothetical protein [Cyanophyceae]|uniref:hypothetical protein n=1 Tax=Cyanophyceae TaxID=3028117 RepID=UPI00168641A7|nr:hypothetical protein [Trichocoleus sp. FACHB-40]MBD2002474.1 hypothetical protein [Trichocoleus sp. FACHB-40]